MSLLFNDYINKTYIYIYIYIERERERDEGYVYECVYAYVKHGIRIIKILRRFIQMKTNTSLSSLT